MIDFNTEKAEIYNKIIHNYLNIELYEDNEDSEKDIGDIIEIYMPQYLFREQYERCIEVFEELYHWTEDEFYHDMTAFHEVALYYFLIEMGGIKEDYESSFKDAYYDPKLQEEIDKYIKKDLLELEKENIKDPEEKKDMINIIEEECYSPSAICGNIFSEIDFVELPDLYNEHKRDMPIIAQMMGINLDYYFEILPKDIKEKYKSKHITLTGEVSEFFSYLQKRITDGSLAELFFENDKSISKKKIHVIIENLMDAYFIGKGVDISREVLIKNGKVDFKLFRNDKKYEKVLIEIKKASSSYLKSGYEKQLCEYIRCSGCQNAFYLIVCFTDKEYETAYNFIKNNIYTDTFQMYINIAILDARKKVAPSKQRRNKKEMN